MIQIVSTRRKPEIECASGTRRLPVRKKHYKRREVS